MREIASRRAVLLATHPALHRGHRYEISGVYHHSNDEKRSGSSSGVVVGRDDGNEAEESDDSLEGKRVVATSGSSSGNAEVRTKRLLTKNVR